MTKKITPAGRVVRWGEDDMPPACSDWDMLTEQIEEWKTAYEVIKRMYDMLKAENEELKKVVNNLLEYAYDQSGHLTQYAGFTRYDKQIERLNKDIAQAKALLKEDSDES